MTFKTLSDECWAGLPAVRKHIAGRAAVNKLLADAVLEFESDRLESCLTAAERAGYRERLLGRVKRRNAVIEDKDGFAILAFLAVTIAAAVISWLIQRWLDNHFPKEQLDEWKQELAS